MTRSQQVVFAFIGAVAVVVALWLWWQEPTASASPTATTVQASASTTTAASTASTSTASTASRAAAERARATAEGTARAQAGAKPRTTRTTEAQALGRRLELIAAAIDEARQRPAATLERDAIVAGVKGVQPEIQGCYEQALAQNPALAGTVKVLFEISADPDDDSRGAVVAGEVDSAMGSPFFEACVLQAIVGAGFPRPEGGGVVKVTYPFRFAAVEADGEGEAAAAP